MRERWVRETLGDVMAAGGKNRADRVIAARSRFAPGLLNNVANQGWPVHPERCPQIVTLGTNVSRETLPSIRDRQELSRISRNIPDAL
jgi:hypothetical protein